MKWAPTLRLVAATGTALMWTTYRRWHLHWGATETETRRRYAGDELIDDPLFAPTRAITVNSSPEQLWPWIVQIGIKQRAVNHAADGHRWQPTRGGINTATSTVPSVQLLWIPLGAGQRLVKISGKVFEAISALWSRRASCDIYHAAVVISVPEGRYTVEMAPIPDDRGGERGVVAEGPVGLKALGRFRLFRYEIRRWRGGNLSDANEAVSTLTLSTDQAFGQRLLNLLPAVPTPVWGRDELRTGDMWNSNSVVAWLLAQGNLDMTELHPPPGGRAPGWESGLVVASRSGQ